MTNRAPNPQPTSNTKRRESHSIYLWPRSKDPEQQRVYDLLHEMGWRFDAVFSEWHTPETEALQAFGRLEWWPGEIRIQPPWAKNVTRPDPILVLELEQV